MMSRKSFTWRHKNLKTLLRLFKNLKQSADDLNHMQDAIERMKYSKLDLVLFCNAYESEEIAYEKRNLNKASQKGKFWMGSSDLFPYEDQHNEEYSKLKREVMQIF